MSQSPGYYVQITSRRRLSHCSIPLWRYSTVIDDNESTVQSHCSGELRKTTHLQRPIPETVSTGNASILLVYRYPWLVPSVVRPLKKDLHSALRFSFIPFSSRSERSSASQEPVLTLLLTSNGLSEDEPKIIVLGPSRHAESMISVGNS